MNPSICLAGPIPNTDISGIGSRLAMYCQNAVLAFLAFQGTPADLEDSIVTYIVTNTVYGLTTLALSFGAAPQLSLYDALMIIYLLSGSWIPLFFSVLRYTSLHAQQGPTKGWKHRMIPTAFTFQGFVMVGLVISVFYAWSAYGSDAACNNYRVLSFFHPFPVAAPVQAVAMAGFGALPVACVLVVSSGVPLRAPRMLVESMPGSAAVLAVLMSLWIANVELLRIYNKPQSGEEAWVSFGQIIPVLSLIGAIPKVYATLRKKLAHPTSARQANAPVVVAPTMQSLPTLATMSTHVVSPPLLQVESDLGQHVRLLRVEGDGGLGYGSTGETARHSAV